jgi:hypothetical protein
MPIKADVRNDFDAYLARHSTRSSATTTVKPSGLSVPSRQESMVSPKTTTIRASEHDSHQPYGSPDTEKLELPASQVNPTPTPSRCRSISSFDDINDQLAASVTSTPSVSDDWEHVEASFTPPDYPTDRLGPPFSLEGAECEDALVLSTPCPLAQLSTPDQGYDYAYSPLASSSGWNSPTPPEPNSRALSSVPGSSLPLPVMSASSGLQ